MPTANDSRASDFFDTAEEFEDALSTAEDNATTSWEMEFMDSLRRKYERFGSGMYFSDAQHTSLNKIVNKRHR